MKLNEEDFEDGTDFYSLCSTCVVWRRTSSAKSAMFSCASLDSSSWPIPPRSPSRVGLAEARRLSYRVIAIRRRLGCCFKVKG